MEGRLYPFVNLMGGEKANQTKALLWYSVVPKTTNTWTPVRTLNPHLSLLDYPGVTWRMSYHFELKPRTEATFRTFLYVR